MAQASSNGIKHEHTQDSKFSETINQLIDLTTLVEMVNEVLHLCWKKGRVGDRKVG